MINTSELLRPTILDRAWVIVCCVLFCSVFSEIHGQTIPPCGHTLASYKGVAAYSNGPDATGQNDQWTDHDCDPKNLLPPNGMFGEQYQCTEYVKHFYYQALGITRALQWTGDAVNYFGSANVDLPTKFANNKMLTAMSNGGPAPPAPDDIIVFSGPNGFGHVAIITDVTTNTVTLIEQNWSITGTASLPLSTTCTLMGCSFAIGNRAGANGSVFTVLGWMRAPERTVFTTLSNSSFISTIGSVIGTFCALPCTYSNLADAFIPTQTLRLSSVQVAISYLGGPNQLTVYLAMGDMQPGFPIETFSFTNLPPGPVVVTATSISNPQLMAGTKYWIVVTAPDLIDSLFTWQYINPLVLGTVSAQNGLRGGAWLTGGGDLSAFSVTGMP